MRAIAKAAEPVRLTQYRAQPGAAYDGGNFTPVKEEICRALLVEQGHLCAYCMQRITSDSMKVEHWHSQKRYSSEQLIYRNMLGCCTGNEGKGHSPKDQHCDTRKGDRDISINPADPAHHQRMMIRYAGDGTIRSDNAQFDTEIDSILNLNWTQLRRNRKSVFDAVIQALSHKPGPRTPGQVQSLIGRWTRRDADGRLPAYCDVAIYCLTKKLKACS